MRDARFARALALAACVALCGCAGPATVEAGTPALPPPADASEFVSAQRARVANLGDFVSRGSAEMRWKDERGDHFEQVQVELAWRGAGERMAMRADKLGERLAWSGADATRWWVFDLGSDPSRLQVGPRGTVPADSPLPFAGPESLLELMAARPWPASTRVGAREAAGGWWMEWNLSAPIGSWTASRALVSAPGALPVAVQLLDAAGGVIASSELSNPMTVEVRGQPPGAWPLVAGKTRLRTGSSASTLDVFWDAPGTDPDRLKDRLFDLAVLREVLRPKVVDENAGSAAR